MADTVHRLYGDANYDIFILSLLFTTSQTFPSSDLFAEYIMESQMDGTETGTMNAITFGAIMLNDIILKYLNVFIYMTHCATIPFTDHFTCNRTKGFVCKIMRLFLFAFRIVLLGNLMIFYNLNPMIMFIMIVNNIVPLVMYVRSFLKDPMDHEIEHIDPENRFAPKLFRYLAIWSDLLGVGNIYL